MCLIFLSRQFLINGNGLPSRYIKRYTCIDFSLAGTDSRQTVVDRQKDSGKAFMLHVHKIPIDVIASSLAKAKKLFVIGLPILI